MELAFEEKRHSLKNFEYIKTNTLIKLSSVTKLGFNIVFLQIETYNPINLIIVDNWDRKAGQLIN